MTQTYCVDACSIDIDLSRENAALSLTCALRLRSEILCSLQTKLGRIHNLIVGVKNRWRTAKRPSNGSPCNILNWDRWFYGYLDESSRCRPQTVSCSRPQERLQEGVTYYQSHCPSANTSTLEAKGRLPQGTHRGRREVVLKR